MMALNLFRSRKLLARAPAPQSNGRFVTRFAALGLLLLTALAASTTLNAAPVTYGFILVGQNAQPGFSEIQGPIVQVAGNTYGGVGKEVIVVLNFAGDTADVQPWSFAGAAGYEIRRGVASFIVYNAPNGTVLANGSFDASAGMYVSIDNVNGGIGLGSGAVWPATASGFPGQPAYPFAHVFSASTAYDLKSTFSGIGSADQFQGALSCPGFPGSCAAPLALPLTDGTTFSMTLPSGNIENTVIATVLPLVNFAGFGAQTTLGTNDSFTVKGNFRLGRMSNGINPVQEPFTLTINGYTAALPAGSFESSSTGVYAFDGLVNGKSLYVQITSNGNLSYSFLATGTGSNLGGRPFSVGLTIGDNTGTATLPHD
jgi:hypothetical protein